MTKRRRNKKRQRSKSSPQTLSISKKHRQTGIEQGEEAEATDQTVNTDTESIADKSVLPEISGSVKDSETDSTDSVEQYFEQIDKPNKVMDTFAASGVPDEDHEPQQSQSILTGNPGVYPSNQDAFMNSQSFHDPGYAHMSMPMNMPPQHMQHMMNMSPHMQPPPPLTPPPPPPMYIQQKLSDDDVLRIAQKMHELLKKDIEDIVEKKVTQKVKPLQQEVDKLTKSLAKVQKELKEVKIHNDDLEQYSRRSCVRISGLEEKIDEDTTQVVLDLAARCGVDIRVSDIDRCHRVGKPKTATGENEDISDEPREVKNKREIIVKFQTHAARLEMLKGRAYFRDRKEKIFINEDLTKTRKTLAFNCRKLKKDSNSGVEKTWVFNGNVYIQDSDNKKILVTSIEDLDPYKPENEDTPQ